MITETEHATVAPPQVALVQGQPMTELPQDLYIPPDALEVFLETFQGPLDLLLYLIKHQNLDILNIPIAEITRQYMEYVNLMQEIRLELAAEYLVMAAVLAEIKSRFLLPKPKHSETEEEDPRAELVRRLQEYEQIKLAAQSLDELPRHGRDIYLGVVASPDLQTPKVLPKIELNDLLQALKEVLHRVEMSKSHHIQKESISIRVRMAEVLARVQRDKFTNFIELFNTNEGRMGVVVTFIAILELMKQSLIEIVQTEPYSPIHIKAMES